jgi:hypothetical protein
MRSTQTEIILSKKFQVTNNGKAQSGSMGNEAQKDHWM